MCSPEPSATTSSDLSRVANGTASAGHLDPKAFFAKTYPTRGMNELLKGVCPR
jgi:predicted AAA+ superfamily ATPase